VSVYEPSNRLRFVKRNMTSEDGQLGWIEKILQQEWVEFEYDQEKEWHFKTGRTEWRDIEFIKTEQL